MTARPVPPRPPRRPFTVADEVNCYFDSKVEPNNVQLEAWLPGHLSPDALRAAVTRLLADVPAARACRADAAWWRAGYAWEFPPAPDTDLVSVLAWQTPAELDAARAAFLAAAPELDRGPAFRLLLAQGPDWDSLILNAHHAAYDGRSCVALLRLLAERYDQGPLAAGPTAGHGEASYPQAAAWTWSHPGNQAPAHQTARLAKRGPARIARDHAAQRPTDGPGYGLSLLDWPGIPVVAPGGGHPPVTVNDLLITALAETVSRWNTARRQRPRYIRISMPLDTRPPADGPQPDSTVLGNLSRLATITVDPRLPASAAAVATQTKRAKASTGPLVSPVFAALASSPLPVPVKRRLVRLALRVLGTVACDTSLLSNLGVIADPPAFGPLVTARMWFSTSTHMPRGLAVGALTVGGRLHLCFRYCTVLLDEAGGRAFAAEFAAALTDLCGQAAGETAGQAAGQAGR